jgi:hypothetical protein
MPDTDDHDCERDDPAAVVVSAILFDLEREAIDSVTAEACILRLIEREVTAATFQNVDAAAPPRNPRLTWPFSTTLSEGWPWRFCNQGGRG